MKKHISIILVLVFALTACLLSACGNDTGDKHSVKCYNGIFVGSEENGILSFKGIPFAKEEEPISGPVIHELADQICGAWAGFALAADPSYNGVEWPEYSLEKWETMMFNDNGTVFCEDDPLSIQRELIVPLMYHYHGL